MITLEAKVGARGQAVIPKPIRDQVGIRPGDKLAFRIEAGTIIVEKAADEDVVDAFLNAYEKRELPEEIDWDRAHGDQLGHRFDRARQDG